MKKHIDRSTSNRFQWNRNGTDCEIVTTKQFGSSHSWSCTSEKKHKWQVYKHRNLRLAYIAQQHMFHLAEFMNSTPYVYIQRRYQNGYDEALMGPCRGMFFFGWSTRDGFFLLSLSIRVAVQLGEALEIDVHFCKFVANLTKLFTCRSSTSQMSEKALQRRLMEPPNEEVLKRRSELARKYGKYGFEALSCSWCEGVITSHQNCGDFVETWRDIALNWQSQILIYALFGKPWFVCPSLWFARTFPLVWNHQVGSIQSRVVRGNEVLYEVQWKGFLSGEQLLRAITQQLKKGQLHIGPPPNIVITSHTNKKSNQGINRSSDHSI